MASVQFQQPSRVGFVGPEAGHSVGYLPLGLPLARNLAIDAAQLG